MIFILKQYFIDQINELSKKYKNIKNDFNDFENFFDLSDWKHLWKWIYKFRLKNSSIPTWKRGWFRIILISKMQENKIIPLIIYSKTTKENVSFDEILEALKNIN